MYGLDLTHERLKIYHKALGDSQRINIRVDLLDEDEQPIGSMTTPEDLVLEGQMDIDVTQPVTRHLTIDAVDPDFHIPFDARSASQAALWANTTIRAFRGTYISHHQTQQWVYAPIFWGPIVSIEREDESVHIEAAGKETLLLAPELMWRVKTYRKGEQVVDVIRDILQTKGVTRYDLPELDRELSKPLSISRHQEPWGVIKRLSKLVNRHPMFDGSGRLRLRQYPGNPLWHFHDGPEGNMLTPPHLIFDLSTVRNVVEVLGPKPSGKKGDKDIPKRFRYVAEASPAHPLSKESLARHDVNRPLVEALDVDIPTPPGKGATQKEQDKYHEQLSHKSRDARQLADRKLAEFLRDNVTVTFNAVVMPLLEEMDLTSISYEGQQLEVPIKQVSMPLGSSEDGMSVGYLKRLSPRHRKKKTKPPRSGRR